jgi:hypothetical protein
VEANLNLNPRRWLLRPKTGDSTGGGKEIKIRIKIKITRRKGGPLIAGLTGLDKGGTPLA